MSSGDEVEQAVARMRSALPLEHPRFVLREVRAEDAVDLQAYLGLEEITLFLAHPPLSVVEVEERLARWLADTRAVSAVVEVDGRVVGDVRVPVRPASAMRPASTSAVEAWVGYAFHPDVHGTGLARAAVAAMVDLALREAGARRVTARVFAPAVPSSRLLAALGFHLDGVDRAAVLSPDGTTWWDDEAWSLLPGELVVPVAGRGDPAAGGAGDLR